MARPRAIIRSSYTFCRKQLGHSQQVCLYDYAKPCRVEERPLLLHVARRSVRENARRAVMIGNLVAKVTA
jgi:hypothetical protein